MRGVHVAAAAVAALLVASFASAQGLGDVAAREKEKRKAEGSPAAKVYTENDLGPSFAPVGVPEALPEASEEPIVASEGGDTVAFEGEGEAASEGEGEAEGEGEQATAAPSPDDERAKAEAAWRQKLDQARKEEQVYRDIIDKLQIELNDMSGGVYNPGRAARMAFLEENQQKLAETQERVATLEEEGRRNAYR